MSPMQNLQAIFPDHAKICRNGVRADHKNKRARPNMIAKGRMGMAASRLTRRKLLRNTALATAGALAAPYVRGAHAAGKLAVGFWDHWVPGANDTLTKL